MQFPGGIFLVCFCDITIPYTTHRKSAQKTNIIIHLQVCLQNQCLVSLKRRCCSLLSWADTQQCSCFYARRFIYSNFNILHILVSCLIKLSPFMRRPSNQMNPSPAVSLLPNMLLLLRCTKSLVSCLWFRNRRFLKKLRMLGISVCSKSATAQFRVKFSHTTQAGLQMCSAAQRLKILCL